MRFFIIILLNILFLNTSQSQSGFSKMYDFNTEAYFSNVLLEEDSLILSGVALNETTGKAGVLFVKMDTFGNIQNHNLYNDSLGSHLICEKDYPLLKTSGGDYMMAGDILSRESDFILVWDANGEVKHFWELPYEPNILTSHLKEIVEVSDGFLAFSTKQLSNYETDVFLTKIDFAGNILWAESFGDVDNSESIRGLWVENEDTYVVTASKGSNAMMNGVKCPVGWILAVNSSGEMLWEWTAEPCEDSYIVGLNRTADGSWLYSTLKTVIWDQLNFGFAPKLVKRDSNFNLIWEDQLAESYWDSNRMLDIKPTPDGNWIFAGHWLLPEPYTPFLPGHFYSPSCLYKFNDAGENIWLRCDTVALDNYTVYHELGGIVVLPSGSIIGVGGFQEYSDFGFSKGWAWVRKVDKDGCLEEECNLTSIVEIESNAPTIKIYPNPTNGELTIDNRLYLQ